MVLSYSAMTKHGNYANQNIIEFRYHILEPVLEIALVARPLYFSEIANCWHASPIMSGMLQTTIKAGIVTFGQLISSPFPIQ